MKVHLAGFIFSEKIHPGFIRKKEEKRTKTSAVENLDSAWLETE
jgi:hypothetical protein